MLRKTNFVSGNYYHIYNRGTDKRNIFLVKNDYLRFLVLLYICNNTKSININNLLSRGRSLIDIMDVERGDTLVDIGAYCLMPNHFHLLIKERTDNGISIFMKKIGTAYAMYINKKNQRNGNLFQGRFRAELVNKDEYLKYLFAYIHLNPIKLIDSAWRDLGIGDFKKNKRFLENYIWSSYNSYVNKDKKDPILTREVFPNYFKNIKDFDNFIDDWLNYACCEDGPRSIG